MISLIIIFALLLICFNTLLFFAQNRLTNFLNAKNEPKFNSSEFPHISLIVSAKNEENNITDLLGSLQQIDYPPDRLEIILIDDNSTDKTVDIIRQNIPAFKNITILNAENKKLPGKKGALQLGIEKSNAEYIFITDADCKPEKAWIKKFLPYFHAGADILFGVAPFYKKENIVNAIARYEFLRSSLLTFSFAALGMPYSATARNFAFRKQVFTELNGYYNTMDTLSGDDDLFIREAVKQKMTIIPVIEKQTFAWSHSKSTLKEYIKQKARHTATSHHYLLTHKILLGFWHVFNLLAIFLLFFSYFTGWFLIPFATKLACDLLVNIWFQKRFGVSLGIHHLFWLPIAYECMLVVNYIASFGKITWK